MLNAQLNTGRPGKLTRRQALAGGAAAAVAVTAPVGAVRASTADPVVALYQTWREANEESLRCYRAKSEGYRALEAEYGAMAPRARADRSFAFPSYVSSEEEIDRRTEPLMQRYPAIGEQRRVALKAALQAERERWDALRVAHGVDRLDDAYDAAARAEDQAYHRLLATPATTPAGSALKIKAALTYAPPELEEEGDMAGSLLTSALRDLERMGAAGA